MLGPLTVHPEALGEASLRGAGLVSLWELETSIQACAQHQGKDGTLRYCNIGNRRPLRTERMKEAIQGHHGVRTLPSQFSLQVASSSSTWAQINESHKSDIFFLLLV